VTQETYISIDIESDGPAPGLYSMLALGAVAFAVDDSELGSWYATLEPLDGAARHPGTMDWWATQPEAWAEVNRGQRRPLPAICEFAAWCDALPGKLTAVAPPAAFDFGFANWYCWAFAGRNPLGFSCLDIKSYAAGLARHPGYRGLSEERILAMAGLSGQPAPLSHVAVDDARQQGRLFMALRRAALSGCGQLAGGLA
jgi:hypothetical protein